MLFGLVGLLAGILLIAIGGFLFFFCFGPGEHQPVEFSKSIVFFGLVFIIIGGLMVFL
jgi:hypothetical protein